jgi:hypothetical protein
LPTTDKKTGEARFFYFHDDVSGVYTLHTLGGITIAFNLYLAMKVIQ